jgi:tripartite-type tricarboxylate transporter receptor subunit TctC
VALAPLVLACHESLGVSNASELIELARTRPGEITYGTSAIGGAPHVAAELFQSLAGIEMRHVRYEHTERLYKELEAGLISISFNNIMSMLPRCRGGSLKALAVTSTGRSAVAPEVPTLIESGLPGYEVTNWVGIVAPKNTPSDVTSDLAEAIARALKSPSLERAFLGAGVSPCATTPIQFSNFMTAELQRWGSIVEDFRRKQEDLSHTPQPPRS